ncbi:hypothetical protein EH331_07330 [Enterococcus faecalis]|nr:hypothetical protein [Enterococcus faecalis]
MNKKDINLQEQLKKSNLDFENFVSTLRANHIGIMITPTKKIYFMDSNSNTNITGLLDELGFEKRDKQE